MATRSRRSAADAADGRPATFTPEQRNKIMAALNSDYGYGTRAAFLHRTCAAFLKFSARAWLFYIDLCSFLGVDKNLPKGSVRVAMKKIAEWQNCDERTAQRVVREVTRSGPLPLLVEKPGRQGRVSEYAFVSDPFKIAAVQAVDAARSKVKRGAAIVARQLAIHQAEQRGDLTPELAAKKLKSTALRRDWNTPTRKMPVVADDVTQSLPEEVESSGTDMPKPPPTNGQTSAPDSAQNADQTKTHESLPEMLARLRLIAARKSM